MTSESRKFRFSKKKYFSNLVTNFEMTAIFRPQMPSMIIEFLDVKIGEFFGKNGFRT